MIRGSLIFTLCLLIVSVVLLVATQGYPLKAKIFPMIAICTAIILLVIQATVDMIASRKEVPSGEEKDERLGRKHLTIGVWMVATLLMLWILGFIGTVMFLPFLYLRFSRESWKLSIILSLSCGLFFYVLFGLALKMPLYPGILFKVFSG